MLNAMFILVLLTNIVMVITARERVIIFAKGQSAKVSWPGPGATGLFPPDARHRGTGVYRQINAQRR